jgi:hypothetical protein
MANTNIVRSKYWILKIFWTLAFMGGIAFGVLYNWQLFQQYFQYGTSTSTQAQSIVPTDFPAVTLCNVNIYNEQRALLSILNVERAAISTLCKDLSLLPNKSSSYTDAELVNGCLNYLSVGIKSGIIDKFKRQLLQLGNYDIIRNVSFNLQHDMLLTCFFNGKQCDASDFIWTWNNNYGSCYTFNSGKDDIGNPLPILQTNLDGPSNGLQIELIVRKYIEIIY